MTNLTLAYSVLVLLLAGWAWACSDCPNCGGCTEPTGGTPNSSHCTPDATSGYTFCVWPAISGDGCLPGGSCQRFANQKFCLKWVSDSLWQTTRFTVDCTTTYGVTVDIQWEMTIDGSGNVLLKAYAYLTGTGTVVATLVTYAGTVSLTACNASFDMAYQSDGGQCQNWPLRVTVAPTCCGDCPAVATCTDFCTVFDETHPGLKTAVVHGLTFGDATLPGGIPACNVGQCLTVFDGTDWTLPKSSVTGSFFRGYCIYWAADRLSFISCFGGTYSGARVYLYYDPARSSVVIRAAFLVNPAAGPSNGEAQVTEFLCPQASFSCAAGATNTFTARAVSVGDLCTFPATITQTWTP